MAANKISKRNNDEISYKILEIFLATLGGLGVLTILRNLMFKGSTFRIGYITFQTICITAAVCALSCSIWSFFQRERRIIKTIARYSLVVLLCCLFVLVYDYISAINLLYVIIPVMGFLALIYYIYMREFFVHSVACILSCIAMWFLSKTFNSANPAKTIVFFGICVGLILLAVAFVIYLRAHSGELKLLSCRVLDEKTNYALLFTTFAIILTAFTLAFLIASAAFAYYLVFAIMGYFIVLAIYFTTKLI